MHKRLVIIYWRVISLLAIFEGVILKKDRELKMNYKVISESYSDVDALRYQGLLHYNFTYP